jgi:hypothetical protein
VTAPARVNSHSGGRDDPERATINALNKSTGRDGNKKVEDSQSTLSSVKNQRVKRGSTKECETYIDSGDLSKVGNADKTKNGSEVVADDADAVPAKPEWER